MEIQSSQKFCIITPLSPKLDARETNRLVEELKSHAHQTVGLDLSYVQDCTIDFLQQGSLRQDFSIYNLIYSHFLR